ncbi:MAG: orotate phosphoribosyltransferase [Gemmatimonadaceae bacterium]|nr:orotate phosphoribosyltransferase [Gemmatimonadaceae bacterium]
MITANVKTELIELLARHAYKAGAVSLSSGKQSDYYVDSKVVTYGPEGAILVGTAVWDAIRDENVAGVGGLTLGADAIVVATVIAAHYAGYDLPGFIVRKEPKKHGMKRMIEGVLPEPGSRIAIVDDVVTSGGSVFQSIDEAERDGLEVAIVVPLVDREEGAREKIESRGIKFTPICTARQLRRIAIGR